MLRSITFIRAIHTALHVILTGLLLVLLYEVIFDRITALTWIAVGLFLAEGLILLVNGWECPLTRYTETLGAAHGRVTDFFLPRWFADRAFQIYGGLFGVAVLFLLLRVLT
jgi:hypothetical protein